MSTKDYLDKDFYKALGVAKDADQAAIKKAYRSLARQFHPDANQSDPKAEERFKAVSEAYDVLSDPKRRKEYDEARKLFGGGGGGFRFPGSGGSAGGSRPGAGTPGGFDLGDLIGQAGGAGAGGIGDLLGGIFGNGRARTPSGAAGLGSQPRRGADLESSVTLSFQDALSGVTVPIQLASDTPCPTCSGTGARAGSTPRVCPRCEGTGTTSRNQGGFGFSEPCRDCRGRGLLVDDPCPVCEGSGRGRSSRTIQVRVPAGVSDGQRIRLKGRGAQGERGGPSGDLYLDVKVSPHRLFGRRDDNLTLTVPVSFAEAALGGDISVPTIDGGPVTLRVAAGTGSGRTLRVRGRGTTRKDGTRGDLLVTLEVAVPQNLSSKARSALEEFRDATAGDDPRAGLDERTAAGS